MGFLSADHMHIQAWQSLWGSLSFICFANYVFSYLLTNSFTTTHHLVRYSLKKGYCIKINNKVISTFLGTMNSITLSSSKETWLWCIKLSIWNWPELFHFNALWTKEKLWAKTRFPPHSCTQVWLSGNHGTQPVFSSLCSTLSPSPTSCSWIQWFAKIETPGPSTLQREFSFHHFKLCSCIDEGFFLGSHLSEICGNKKKAKKPKTPPRLPYIVRVVCIASFLDSYLLFFLFLIFSFIYLQSIYLWAFVRNTMCVAVNKITLSL